jgi:GTP diphosphokinase / guanosine-3',5'-bis(diphosphate) 3'-diphosphatase
MDIQIEGRDFEQFLSALRFAAEKHRDQRRKDTPHSPYINHPIAVAETLWRLGEVRDMVTLVAALLHDTVEDTGTAPDEISTRFGNEVRAVVMEVTDDKSLPKTRRKELQVETAPHKSPRARQIKLADKINNVVDITYSPPGDWSKERMREYLDWTERVVNGLRGQNPRLEAEYDRVLAEGRVVLEKA